MDTLLKRYRQWLLEWITRSTLTMWIAAACCLSSGLATAEPTFPVSAHLKKVEGRVVAAWVIVLYPPAFYLTNLTEDELKQRGCNYIVNRKPELSMLMAILQRGDIGDRGEIRRQSIDPRIAIYLQLEDGGQEKLLFEGSGRVDEPSFGQYMETFVLAHNPLFLSELRQWTSSLTPQFPIPRGCHPPKVIDKK